jgi:hypothetical protein
MFDNAQLINAPAVHHLQDGERAFALFGQSIFDARRNFRISGIDRESARAQES